jgi:hypothetical protein
MKLTDQNYTVMPKIKKYFLKITCAKNASPRVKVHLKFSDQQIEALMRGEFFPANKSC